MTKAIQTYIHGIDGRMGKELQKSILESTSSSPGPLGRRGSPASRFVLSKTVDKASLILDFSSIEGNKTLLSELRKFKKKSILIGTTGLDQKVLDSWKQLSKKNHLNVLIAPNTSLGVLTLKRCIALAFDLLKDENFDISILETHHRNKKDAPSGTAKLLKSAIPQKIKVDVHSIRGGGVFGEHEVRFLGDDEEITLSHRAFSCALFANGALSLAEWLLGQKPNLYALTDIK